MRWCIAVTCFTVALNLAACREQTATAPALRPVFDAGGGQSGMTLHPSGFGPHSYAAWKAHQGEPDGHGNADFALYFQKLTETAVFAAGVAVVDGLEGQPVTTLDTLSWEHRAGGHCGAGAPRWNVGITGASGTEYTVFLGCSAAAHFPGQTPGWTLDFYDVPAIAAAILAQAGSDGAAGTIRSLAIVFDEGTDAGEGFVFLDNVRVNQTQWTQPADNSN